MRLAAGAMVGGPTVLVLVLVLLVGWSQGALCLNSNPVPCKTARYQDVLDSVARFSAPGVWDYSTVTLSDHERVLYVGAREALFALDPDDISRQRRPPIEWPAPQDKKQLCASKGKNNQTECFNYICFLQSYNSTHLYTCGTYAYQPKCTYVNAADFTLNTDALEDGRGKCPYDPAKGHTGLIVDEELYSATLFNFMGTEQGILRHLGQQRYSLRTSDSHTWLKEADFVGSALVRESLGSEEGDDDKIYFFFSERPAEERSCHDERTVARVARVCRGDSGNAWTLQKKWTTFLKARLVCSLPGRHVAFNTLRATFTLPGQDWSSTVFFGVFHARWGDVDVSAVCQYPISAVKKVFNGDYSEYQDHSQRWARYTGPVPSPRPGACITNWHRENGYNSSLKLPHATLTFAMTHPLMAEEARARPLLVAKGVNFTRLAVDRVSALGRRSCNVLFIGTADGWLQRVVILGSEAHVLEEIQLFETPQPVDSLTISHSKKYLYIGSRSEVLQLPLANCSRYRSQPDCLLARDPYCAWDSQGRACVRIDLHRGSTSSLSQDLMLERFSRGQAEFDQPVSIPSPEPSLRYVAVVVGSDVVLPCRLVSNLAQPFWVFNGRRLHLGDPESGGPRFDRALGALVVPGAGQARAGRYVCYSEEQGVRVQTERYQVEVVASAPLSVKSRAPGGSAGLFWVLVVTLGWLGPAWWGWGVGVVEGVVVVVVWAEGLRRTLQQRSVLPDANPEESSVKGRGALPPPPPDPNPPYGPRTEETRQQTYLLRPPESV